MKALIFDVFGTLVDWRQSIAIQAEQALRPLGYETDWLAFADAWRNEYQPAMERVRSGNRPFCKLDILHRENLDIVLSRLGWNVIDDATRAQLNLAWHRLDAWPDVSQALLRLRQRYLLAPCSNGHIALMVNLARHNGWHWDAITGAEIALDYKPQAKVYQRSAEALGCRWDETTMVAAHSSDLAAAKQSGLHTAFIGRPNEYGPGLGESKATTSVDFEAVDLAHLADILDC